jgi:hypothetical protein
MSNDDAKWFAPKRYGYGAGLPIKWQGWALTIGFALFTIGIALEFAQETRQLIAILLPVTAAFLLTCARTTKGGWRWRWGEDD